MPSEEEAAIALQKIQRGNSARALAADVKDETARQQWVDYYLQIGDEAQARDLGWRPEGEAAAVTMADEPPGAPPAAAPAADAAAGGGDGGKEAAAAAAIQAAMRGKVVRAEFQDFKDETARQQWMAYYLELGEYDAAKEYGWEPPPGWTPPAAGEAPAATSSEGAAAPVVPPLKFGEAEAGQLAITNEGGELAESEIPIFSARWFGQVFAAFTPRGETEEEETKRKEEKAAILVQAFARTLLARIAVKDESRKYRLLALYAHIEEKHATKIQTQFRESRRRKDEAMAELNKQAVETREAPATSVVVAPPPKLTAPPRVKEQTEIDSKVAEVSQMHAATVIQKSQRAASKKALTTELKGQLYKRSNMTPRFQRRWFYVVGDAAGNHALCYRVGDVDGSGGGEEKRIPVASITAVEIDNEMRYEWSVDATVRDAKYAFRCDTHDEMTRWVDGLRMLMM